MSWTHTHTLQSIPPSHPLRKATGDKVFELRNGNKSNEIAHTHTYTRKNTSNPKMKKNKKNWNNINKQKSVKRYGSGSNRQFRGWFLFFFYFVGRMLLTSQRQPFHFCRPGWTAATSITSNERRRCCVVCARTHTHRRARSAATVSANMTRVSHKPPFEYSGEHNFKWRHRNRRHLKRCHGGSHYSECLRVKNSCFFSSIFRKSILVEVRIKQALGALLLRQEIESASKVVHTESKQQFRSQCMNK